MLGPNAGRGIRDLRAFTLAEILICVAIVGALVGIALPLLKSARDQARQATCISNLRQCATAISLYADVCGGLPPYSAAVDALSDSPAECPMDSWHRQTGRPRIGSYAYIRGATRFSDDADWNELLASKTNIAILACIFHASTHAPPFEGNVVPRKPPPGFGSTDLAMPDAVIAARLDTSARRISIQHIHAGGTTLLLSWDALFYMLNREDAF